MSASEEQQLKAKLSSYDIYFEEIVKELNKPSDGISEMHKRLKNISYLANEHAGKKVAILYR